jgi:hypothetical protein|tara:strand:+ start:876 stop:1181 length:306 start_codon:yes stop_codon:yes gene_type:complete
MSEITVREYTNEYGLKDKWTYEGKRLIRTEMTFPKTKLNKKPKIMSAKQDLFEQIAEQFNILQENNEGSTKTSQAKARKAAGEIKKLITPYKKANMDAVKG